MTPAPAAQVKNIRNAAAEYHKGGYVKASALIF